jgi:non-heme chloroperoxidase
VPPYRAGAGREVAVFIHGLRSTAESWARWVDEFDVAGYDTVSFRWPGEGSAPGRTGHLSRAVTVTDLLRQLTAQVAFLDRPPVAVGHGVGGLLAQLLLDRGSVAAAIALAPAPCGPTAAIRWLASSAAPFRTVRARRPACGNRSDPPTVLLHPADTSSRFSASAAAGKWDELVPGRSLPLLGSLVLRRPPPQRVDARGRGPLLLVSGAQDRVVPERTVAASHRRYRRRLPGAVTDHVVLPDRSHALVVDEGWQAVAFRCLDWLTAEGL